MMIDLRHELQRFFGYQQFRTGQEEIITDVLQRKNVLAMLPTGTGKSICYQLPALLLPGITVVVSPLLALMEDQVQQLKSRGIKRVVAINSFQTYQERKQILAQLHKYKMVYVSPEILQNESVFHMLQQVPISLFVIDEAHCISQWGHDFRTDYLKLHEIITALHAPPVLALTATATLEVQDDIVKQLRLKEVTKHLYSVDRPNIAIKVVQTATIHEKVQQIIHLTKRLQGPGMVYFSSRKWAEFMTHELKKLGIRNVAFYHGGMENEERILIQQQFLSGEIEIVCCTSAFGMGINKPDVRYIIHFHYPSDIESYLQEIGRAGRDLKPSIAILFQTEEDAYITKQLIDRDLPSMEQIAAVLTFLKMFQNSGQVLKTEDEQQLILSANLTDSMWKFLRYHLMEKNVICEQKTDMTNSRKIFYYLERIVKERVRIKKEKLSQMEQWLRSTTCRRAAYLKYFAEQKKQQMENCCDICGIALEQYYKRQKVQVKAPPRRTWQTELQLLLHQKEIEGEE